MILFYGIRFIKKKGSSLNQDKLLDVINFMNEKRIRMVCLKYPHYKYKKSIRFVNEKLSLLLKNPYLNNPKEKILAPLYFYALKENSYKKYHYEGQVCIETQIQIDKVLHKLSYLAKDHDYKLSMGINHRRNQHMLKFADFVASCGRKIDEFLLDGQKIDLYIKIESQSGASRDMLKLPAYFLVQEALP